MTKEKTKYPTREPDLRPYKVRRKGKKMDGLSFIINKRHKI